MKVGPSFSNNIYSPKTKSRSIESEPTQKPWLLFALLIGFLLFLSGRLFLLQIINGFSYRQLSDVNRTKTITIPAPRGIFTDRNGVPLVENIASSASLLKNQIDPSAFLAQRAYPYGSTFAHVLGYVGKISADDLNDPTYAGYTANNYVGRAGLEEYYESDLRGVDGRRLIEVNAQGNFIRVLGDADPIPGATLQTTLDLKMQQAAVAAMRDVKKGAAVVSTPQGEILAIVSKPDYDPNLFSLGHQLPGATVSAYPSVASIVRDNENQPLLDRAIAGLYPPGSTFKLIVATGALEEHLIDANFVVEDTGILTLGGFSFANWYYTQYGKVDGLVNVVKAIQRSNDIFFYKVGSMLGADRIAAWATKFHLGQKTGIDLFGEAKGLVPTKEWKQQVLHEDWYTGDDYHYGIGQGFLLVTPLQVNLYTQAIANNGTIYQPHLLLHTSPKVLATHIMQQSTIDLLRQGMIAVCSPGGVAWPLFNYSTNQQITGGLGDDYYELPSSASAKPNSVGVRIACKTGTAEHGDTTQEPHAWITVMAPAYHPQIIITVLSESSGEGSNVAGPIAKQILDAWFNK